MVNTFYKSFSNASASCVQLSVKFDQSGRICSWGNSDWKNVTRLNMKSPQNPQLLHKVAVHTTALLSDTGSCDSERRGE